MAKPRFHDSGNRSGSGAESEGWPLNLLRAQEVRGDRAELRHARRERALSAARCRGDRAASPPKRSGNQTLARRCLFLGGLVGNRWVPRGIYCNERVFVWYGA